ncbi:glycosyltransferase family 4 protein [Aequorivita echinoideorum]|uniref:Glycosyltransferase family 4 protein n=1 Tax=Aequorivita echinoideorum TaxID=1549647 RepID=A0ABS5S5G9_9FLAO|nr:glycosyltransferase family 4 protein [Aequorivita echinoideorum]MBT0608466.1 glycosyltransferase family 4 protein [Aequorivita echinoideorum]
MQKGSILYIGNKHSKKGNTVTSVETLGAFLEAEGFQVFSASSYRNKFLRLFDMVLKTITFRNKVNVVLIDTYSTQNFYYAVIVAFFCRFFKLPYIPILRGGNLPNRLKNNPRLCAGLFGKANVNVVPSQYLKEAFEAQGYTNLEFIPNTIELKNYPFKFRETLKSRLLWVRSFAEIYNPILALQILEKMKPEFPNTTLCMVGPDKDGSLARCKKLAEQLNLSVEFKGKLEKSEWIALSENFDIFINTTNFDNMPVSVMEGMALGLPIISTNVGGMPHLIKNGEEGLLVLPDDADLFIAAIKDLLSNPLKAENLALKAREKVEDYDWQRVKGKWVSLLQNV